MRVVDLFLNLRIRNKLLVVYFCLFSAALVVGSEIIFTSSAFQRGRSVLKSARALRPFMLAMLSILLLVLKDMKGPTGLYITTRVLVLAETWFQTLLPTGSSLKNRRWWSKLLNSPGKLAMVKFFTTGG